MADIFVSYSRLDQERAKPVVERLNSLGYSVWSHAEARRGAAFENEVQREVDAARAVLVVWSDSARNASWVIAEAAAARDAGKLVQMRIDNADIPAPFARDTIADMSGAKSEWGPLEDTLAQMVKADKRAETDKHRVGWFATPPATGMPKLTLFAAGTTILAFAGALAALDIGVMTPDQAQPLFMALLAVSAICFSLTALRFRALTRAGG